MKLVNATKWLTFHTWVNKIKVIIIFMIPVAVAGQIVPFICPCRLSEGSEWLAVSLCKHTALSHTVGKVANSPIPQLWTRHANPTHRWRQEGIYSPPLDILSQWPGPWCLVGLKAMRTGNHRSKLPTVAPPFTPEALEDCSVVRLKANNVPTAQVHILSGSAAFPQSPAIFLGGKGLRYTRAGRPLCVAVIHAKLHEQFSNYGCSQSQVLPQGWVNWPVVDIWLHSQLDMVCL